MKKCISIINVDNEKPKIPFIDSQEALKAISEATKDTPVVLDFDETLFLRNSTAEYIRNLRPRFLGFTLIVMLKVLRPWAWLPKPFRGYPVRDWFLVVVPTILLPWTIFLWRSKARQLAETQGNSELIIAVNQKQPEVPLLVASLGFNFIIRPIVHHLPLRCDLIIACGFWQGAKDRNRGKLSMMQEVLSESELKSSIVVTDSREDLPILSFVARPCLVTWSLAKYIDPFQDYWLFSFIKHIVSLGRN